jgi:hypothetical protein
MESLDLPVEHGCGNDDLDFLTTRETLHLVVLGDITIQTHSLENLSNSSSAGISHTSTFSRRLHIVKLSKKLGESFINQDISGDPGIVLDIHVSCVRKSSKKALTL